MSFKEESVAYASRSLTSAERAYAQIEKEMLAITFAGKKFHPYIYEKVTQVESDHKPLESIMTKPLCAVPPRLQRSYTVMSWRCATFHAKMFQ